MIEHQNELERIFHSDQDTLKKMQRAHELFKNTQAQLWDLRRYGRVSLDV